MKLVRRVLGVIVGYVIFVASAVLIFRLGGRDPDTQQHLGFIVGSIAFGAIFAAIGGYVSALLGGGNPRVQGGAVGLLIALGATVSLLAGPNAGPMWSRLAGIVLMAPSALEDPSGLFNSSLEGSTRRAIDFHEGERLDEKALKALVRAAVSLNTSQA